MLAQPLGLAQDLLVAHQSVDADRCRGRDDNDVGKQPQDRAAEAQLLEARCDRDHADEPADEPGVPLDQAAFVPARKAEAGDAVGGFHADMMIEV